MIARMVIRAYAARQWSLRLVMIIGLVRCSAVAPSTAPVAGPPHPPTTSGTPAPSGRAAPRTYPTAASAEGTHFPRFTPTINAVTPTLPLTDQGSIVLDITVGGQSAITRNSYFSPDGRQLLTLSSRGLQLWDAARGLVSNRVLSSNAIEQLRHPAQEPPDSPLLGWDTDGIVLRDPVRKRFVWVDRTGAAVREQTFPEEWFSFGDWTVDMAVGLVTDGDYLAIVHPDGTRLLTSTYRLSSLSSAYVTRAVWNPAGTIVAVGQHHGARVDGQVDLYTATGQHLRTMYVRDFRSPPAWHSDALNDLAWSPDGTRLAVATRFGVGIWDATGEMVAVLDSAESVRHLAWDPTGQWLAVSTDGRVERWGVDGTTRVGVWDAARMVCACRRPPFIGPLTWSPTGRQLTWEVAVEQEAEGHRRKQRWLYLHTVPER